VSFKAEIEIDPDDDNVHCGCCRWADTDRGCCFFDVPLWVLQNKDGEFVHGAGYMRCPACLAAEKRSGSGIAHEKAEADSSYWEHRARKTEDSRGAFFTALMVVSGWQEDVARALGFLNQPEGQEGYEVASAQTVIEAWQAMERECIDLRARLLLEQGKRQDLCGIPVEADPTVPAGEVQVRVPRSGSRRLQRLMIAKRR